MSLVQAVFGRFKQTVTAYAGDDALMRAAVSACANVIVADGEVAGAEFEAALKGMLADPVLEKGYDSLMLEEELYDGIGRARTRAGRMQNIHFIEAIADRPTEQRQSVFLIAADVADFEGISSSEHRALTEVAGALGLDRDVLLS
ncbi:Tellurite resistance protein TerB [Methylobacterium terricola]|uniref:Tellurite resistance protein TerB n=1 Tax=Methylobacterium terricola TaxID=2583531 RepID=A0A5C4L713_9HYPH|nr:tellurite resistance TerB family protein [Methylobacterium terricola]TNC07648.1 Tellurite resistance protein TerB [Methylobacterium terricola]